jgi:hypothetical protein
MKWTHILALLLIGLVASLLTACGRGAGSLSQVTVSPAVISPNGNGVNDLARIGYKISAPSRVSIYLTDSNGKRYPLRDEAQRSPSPMAYELLFNGVSNGRLMPNGQYTWHVDASWAGGSQSYSGTLTI